MSPLQPCDLVPRAYSLEFHQGLPENGSCDIADMQDKITTEKSNKNDGRLGKSCATKLRIEFDVTYADRIFKRSFLWGSPIAAGSIAPKHVRVKAKPYKNKDGASGFFRIIFLSHCPSPSGTKILS